jgi:ribosome modulation factor
MIDDATSVNDALIAGFDAGSRGQSYLACPYPPRSATREAWLAGWRDGTQARQVREIRHRALNLSEVRA